MEEETRFLAPLPRLVQRLLQMNGNDDLSPEEREECQNFDWSRIPKLQLEYEQIIQHIPKKWAVYRKHYADTILSVLPPNPPGRPRADALAEEALELQRQGKTYADIAKELNKLHGPGTTNRQAIRQLIISRRKSDSPTERKPD